MIGRRNQSKWNLDALLKELLSLVDLGGQIRAAAAIGVVEEHEGAVGLAHFVLGDGALTVCWRVSVSYWFPFDSWGPTPRETWKAVLMRVCMMMGRRRRMDECMRQGGSWPGRQAGRQAMRDEARKGRKRHGMDGNNDTGATTDNDKAN